jgi:hypothetical protein
VREFHRNDEIFEMVCGTAPIAPRGLGSRGLMRI